MDLWRDRQGQDWTILGAADRDDDAERGAALRGYRWNIRDGQRVKRSACCESSTTQPQLSPACSGRAAVWSA
jgi:hypothetical protein